MFASWTPFLGNRQIGIFLQTSGSDSLKYDAV